MSSSKSYKIYLNKSKNIVTCPICKKSGRKSHISRHIMNSRDEKHSDFIEEQNFLLNEIYNNEEFLDVPEICCRNDVWCSPSYVRKKYSILPNYRKKLSATRSTKMKQQYKNGREPCITAGWKPKNKKEAGKRVISDEKYNKVIELYSSSMTLKDVSKHVNCKCETVYNYWVSCFGKKEVSKRNRLAKIRKLSVLDDEKINLLKRYFYENKTKHDISNELNVSTGTVLNFFRKTFTIQERKNREKRIRKEALRRSFQSSYKSSKVGSKPEKWCFLMLKNMLEYNVIHHDIDICPPYEIDITIPKLKIAINWDGPTHFRPIYGEEKLEKVKNRDKKKIKILLNNGWKVITVMDNCNKSNKTIVKNVVNDILYIKNQNFNHKIIKVGF